MISESYTKHSSIKIILEDSENIYYQSEVTYSCMYDMY